MKLGKPESIEKGHRVTLFGEGVGVVVKSRGYRAEVRWPDGMVRVHNKVSLRRAKNVKNN